MYVEDLASDLVGGVAFGSEVRVRAWTIDSDLATRRAVYRALERRGYSVRVVSACEGDGAFRNLEAGPVVIISRPLVTDRPSE